MIEMTEVVKTYRAAPWRGQAPVRALAGVTLRIEPGTAVGVVGLNGAGKSTLLRVLLGYARPTEGRVTIADLPPRAYAQRKGIAYLPEQVTVPGRWTVRRAIRAYAMFAGLGEDAWERADAALDRLGLSSLSARAVATLSKGNVQRLGIAQTLLGDRGLMVLDEPTDGLDPVWIAELRTIVAEWRKADSRRVVIVASHNLAALERMTDHAVLLHNGSVRGEISGLTSGGLEPEFLRRIRELEEARA